jgi:glycosyltransferase involved in cell wall biosynthesis
MLQVCAYTGGKSVASARFRVRQLIAPMRSQGIFIREHAAAFGSFPPVQKASRPLWALSTLAQRIPSVLRSYKADLSLIQREMLSTFVTLEPALKPPRVLDVDDAIWIHMGDKRARRLATLADAIICGNRTVAEHFSQWNRNVRIIHTAVDDKRFTPLQKKTGREIVIGWSGASAGFSELYQIEPVFARLLRQHTNVKLRILADQKPQFTTLPPSQCQYVKWSPEIEVSAIQHMDIGIMPLSDTPWNRGKCSYKMLLYMACGLPVVASPVGMNSDVLAAIVCGFGASGIDQWMHCLDLLISDETKRRTLGKNGRELVSKQFSVDAIVPKLAKEFLSLGDLVEAQAVATLPPSPD